MEITYHREGDYLIPDLTIGEQKQVRLGKYGMMRLNYLKMHKKAEYSIMLIEGNLLEHLIWKFSTLNSSSTRFQNSVF